MNSDICNQQSMMKKMSDLKTKVLIIGAGPAGSTAAYRLARAGFDDFLLVDRCEFPRIKPCAGGISPSAFRFIERAGLEHVIKDCSPRAEMKRLDFTGPRGQRIIMADNMKAMAVNRAIFDHALLNEAKRAGARFIPGFTARELLYDGSGKTAGASDRGRSIESEVTIVATGCRSKSFRERYCADRRPLRLIYSRIGWWKGFELEEGTMEMIFDRDYVPHYGWVFPEGGGTVNIGVCLYEDKLKGKNVADVFSEYLSKYHAQRLSKAVQVGKSLSFVINTTGRVGRVYSNRVLFAGEAGRMCNPATGEGISFAMESGWLAAEAVIHAYERGGAPDEKALEDYEPTCREAFNTRLRRATWVGRFIDSPLFNVMINLSMKNFSRGIISRFLADM
jgi:geranylgeranyl reductase family protein